MVLGATLAEIARAKAGIIKPGVPVVVAPQPRRSLTSSRRSPPATEAGSSPRAGTGRLPAPGVISPSAGAWGDYRGLRSALPGNHQVENAATAIAATWQLSPTGVHVTANTVRDGLAGVRLAGRFERHLLPGGRTVIFDGAHTPASARVLAQAVLAEFPGQRAVIVLGASADKDLEAIGEALHSIARRVIATRSTNPARRTVAVAAALTALGIAAEIETDVDRAVARATSEGGPEELVLVTGSLFVVAEAGKRSASASLIRAWRPKSLAHACCAPAPGQARTLRPPIRRMTYGRLATVVHMPASELTRPWSRRFPGVGPGTTWGGGEIQMQRSRRIPREGQWRASVTLPADDGV